MRDYSKNAKKGWNKIRKNKKTKNCEFCGKEFIYYFERARFCSKDCIMKNKRREPKWVEYYKNYNKKYQEENKEKIKDQIKRNRKRINANDRKRYKEDKQYNISQRLRKNLRFALNHYTNTGKILKAKEYGINYKKILEHLKPFPKNLSEWHIDHIKPTVSFNLEDPEEVKKCFSPENLQWLPAKENQRKGSRLAFGFASTR